MRAARVAARSSCSANSKRSDRATKTSTHGDYGLPNVILDAHGGAGFADVGRAGVADRHQDLARASRSLAYNFGDAYVAPFFDACGIEADPRRIAFYRLLDEFF